MSGLEDEEGESVASEGSLLELREMLGTTWAGEEGGETAGAASAGGGGVRCATCKGIAKYGIEGSKAW